MLPVVCAVIVVGTSLTVGSGSEFIVWLVVSAGLIVATVVVGQIAKRRARSRRGEAAGADESSDADENDDADSDGANGAER